MGKNHSTKKYLAIIAAAIIIILSGFILFAYPALFAHINIQVTNGITSAPIRGARVELYNYNYTSIANSTTDSSGWCHFTVSKNGQTFFWATISASGYSSWSYGGVELGDNHVSLSAIPSPTPTPK